MNDVDPFTRPHPRALAGPPCHGCQDTPAWRCAACGALAVTATRAGACSVAWCDWCAYTVLALRLRSAVEGSSDPLVFLPLYRAPARRRPRVAA